MTTAGDRADVPRARPVVFGEVLFDCFADGTRVLGGAPFNVAWHLQAFGEAPLFVSRVGNDEPGRRVLATMGRWDMTAKGLQTDTVHSTGEVQVRVHDGEPVYDIVDDRAFDHIDAVALPGASASLIYHGSLALRSTPSTQALDALLESSAAPVFMDVNLRAPWWTRATLETRLAHARWVKLNEDELTLLADGTGSTETLALRLLERHKLAQVIVTLGARGALLASDSGQVMHATDVPAADAVVDTVGAGDAFSSVCILGVLHDWPATTLLGRAQAFASLVVAQRGATAEDRRPYTRLLTNWRKHWRPAPGQGQ